MSDSSDWADQLALLKRGLTVIESAAVTAAIPPELLTELKSAVDHCRTALWAAILASNNLDNNDHYESTSLILCARMQRVEEMCGRVLDDVSQGRIWKETPGLGRFVATLGETERSVRSLLEQASEAGTTADD